MRAKHAVLYIKFYPAGRQRACSLLSSLNILAVRSVALSSTRLVSSVIACTYVLASIILYSERVIFLFEKFLFLVNFSGMQGAT